MAFKSSSSSNFSSYWVHRTCISSSWFPSPCILAPKLACCPLFPPFNPCSKRIFQVLYSQQTSPPLSLLSSYYTLVPRFEFYFERIHEKYIQRSVLHTKLIHPPPLTVLPLDLNITSCLPFLHSSLNDAWNIYPKFCMPTRPVPLPLHFPLPPLALMPLDLNIARCLSFPIDQVSGSQTIGASISGVEGVSWIQWEHDFVCK